MKPRTLPVKRQPVSKGIFKRLNAVTRSRKQRVAATANDADLEQDDSSSKISRALTIIFLIHIVAIGLIFIHQRFLDDRSVEAPAASTSAQEKQKASAPAAATGTPATRRSNLPVLSKGEKPYVVKRGDNYARIAAVEEVDETELRQMNKHVEIGPGMILRLPPKRIVAIDPPEVAAIRENASVDRDRGLVEAVPVGSAQNRAAEPILVRGTPANATQPATNAGAPAASGERYVVQQNDTVWRIANRFKVDQNTLMRANGISDPRKLRVGMELVIPR